MESRHRWEGDRVPVGLLRLSVGLEEADVLWADLEQALENGLRERAIPAERSFNISPEWAYTRQEPEELPGGPAADKGVTVPRVPSRVRQAHPENDNHGAETEPAA